MAVGRAADAPGQRAPRAAGSRPSPEPEGVASLWEALREVTDPEVPVSLVDLGLIYDVRRSGQTVEVDVSFTATACPAMGFIQEDIRARLLREPDVDRVETQVVWDPPWTPQRISATGREQLRQFGISL